MSFDPVSHVLSRIIIYLCVNTYGAKFISLLPFPLPNLGFSLAGFTNVPLKSFPLTSSLWHFQKINHIFRLRSFFAVIDSSIPSVIFSTSAITTCIAASASMDFPLILMYQQLSRSNFYLSLLGSMPIFHN